MSPGEVLMQWQAHAQVTGTASDAHDRAREGAAQAQEGAYAARDKASDVYNQVCSHSS